MVANEDYERKRYKAIFRLIFDRFQQLLRQIRSNRSPESIIGVPASCFFCSWSLIELIREDDGTHWTENPLDIKSNKDEKSKIR